MAPCPQDMLSARWFWSSLAPGGGKYVRAPSLPARGQAPGLTHLWAPLAQGPLIEKGVASVGCSVRHLSNPKSYPLGSPLYPSSC